MKLAVLKMTTEIIAPIGCSVSVRTPVHRARLLAVKYAASGGRARDRSRRQRRPRRTALARDREEVGTIDHVQEKRIHARPRVGHPGDDVEKKIDSACVPPLPWAPMSLVMMHVPLGVLTRIM
jgi:hypothetical protein